MCKKQLNYLMAKQGLFSVISFIGDITMESVSAKEITCTGEYLNVLERCFKEIESSESRYFIFNWREVVEIDPAVTELSSLADLKIRQPSSIFFREFLENR